MQPFASSQLSAGPATQTPEALQRSPFVQVFPSLHARLGTPWCVQPSTESHRSFVHGFESAQFSWPPPTQAPVMVHASPVLQRLPSLHARPTTALCAHHRLRYVTL